MMRSNGKRWDPDCATAKVIRRVSAGEPVMDWLGDICRADPWHYKQGFDWASSGNSYNEDADEWEQMKAPSGRWVQAQKSGRFDEAHAIVRDELAPVLIRSSWYQSFKGKVAGTLQDTRHTWHWIEYLNTTVGFVFEHILLPQSTGALSQACQLDQVYTDGAADLEDTAQTWDLGQHLFARIQDTNGRGAVQSSGQSVTTGPGVAIDGGWCLPTDIENFERRALEIEHAKWLLRNPREPAANSYSTRDRMAKHCDFTIHSDLIEYLFRGSYHAPPQQDEIDELSEAQAEAKERERGQFQRFCALLQVCAATDTDEKNGGDAHTDRVKLGTCARPPRHNIGMHNHSIFFVSMVAHGCLAGPRIVLRSLHRRRTGDACREFDDGRHCCERARQGHA